MHLSASTLGAPGIGLSAIIVWLQEANISGIELRVAVGHVIHPAMSRAQRIDVKAQLDDGGIRVTGLGSYVRIAADANDEMVIGSLEAALLMAADLGAPMVRVFPGATVYPGPYDQRPELVHDRHEVDARAAGRLNAVADLCRDIGVHPVLETHDSHPRGEDIARILSRVDGPVGAVWDLMHPWRVGETLEITWQLLAPWLLNARGSVQIKDAQLPEDATPLPIGEGTLPVDQFAKIITAGGYNGVICLEWEKTWYPEIARLDVALASTRRWFDRYWT